MGTSWRWKIPAASTASGLACARQAEKCSGLPAPLEAITGIETAALMSAMSSAAHQFECMQAMGTNPLQAATSLTKVIAAVGAILVHAVEQYLPGPQGLTGAHQLIRPKVPKPSSGRKGTSTNLLCLPALASALDCALVPAVLLAVRAWHRRLDGVVLLGAGGETSIQRSAIAIVRP